MSSITLQILSPSGEVFSGEVEKAILPGVLGPFEVLPRHAPMISALSSGSLKFSQNGEWSVIKVQDGFVEIKNNIITVCIEKVNNG